MSQYSEQLEALTEIRSIMEKSTRFVTLSGATGVTIGFIALIAAGLALIGVNSLPFENTNYFIHLLKHEHVFGLPPRIFIYILTLLTLVLALVVGFYFTARTTKKHGVKLWSRSFKLMMLNIAIPLFTGGVFCLLMLAKDYFSLVAPSMLIFYGLALINGSKYTLQDVNSLGIAEILLGLLALYIGAYGLEFWAIGFGLLHIIYGAKIYLGPK